MRDDETCLWLAYYGDWSEFVVFTSELYALRYAVEHSMSCRQIKQGEGIREQVSR